MKRIVIILQFYFLFSTSLYAQKEANIWYFGDYAGIDFNSGSPVALTDGQMTTEEGCATVSDKNGQLLFYTDGVTVWNKNHQIMSNGTGLKGSYSSSQSAIIVPRPNTINKYYIFTIDAKENNLINGLNYSELDMSLNGGLGNITTIKNIQLVQPAIEKLTAVKHANGTDIWVVAHEYDSNKFYAYLVTSSGVSVVPVISATGVTIDSNVFNAVGCMKFSPDGSKLAIAHGLYLLVQLFNFDNNTGIISNPYDLPFNPTTPHNETPYGLEFSLSGKRLYVSTDNNNSIFQYNLESSNIKSTKTLIALSNFFNIATLQMAPDGKIYCANKYRPALSVINNPEILGVGCNFSDESFFLSGKKSNYGLPSFIQSYFIANFDYKFTCFKDSTAFQSVLAETSYDSIRWNFGDITTGIKNTSTLANPKHVFSDTGTFTVKLIAYKNNLSDTSIKKIRITRTIVKLGIDTILCLGKNLSLNATQSNAVYVWKDGSANPTLSVTLTGQYWVQVTASGCIGKDTIQVTFLPSSTKTIDAQICEGKQYTLPKGSIVNTSGIYKDTINNSIGCDSIIITNLIVAKAPVINKTATICSGNSYILPQGAIVKTSGIYRDTFKTNFNCDSIIITNLTVSPPPTLQKNAHICFGDLYTLPSGKQVNSTGIYRDTIKTLGNCDSIIITNLTVHPINTTPQNIEICAGEIYTLPSGIKVSTTNIYTSIIKTAYNCDSIIKTNLSIVTAKKTTVDTLACDVNSYKLPSGKTVTQNGIYIDSIKSMNGCDSIVTTHLQLDKKPQIQLANELVLCIDSTLILQPVITNSTMYHWQDGSTLPTYTVIQEGSYILNATNVCGETKHTTIVTNEDCSTCELYVPTAFSPNNDGINDKIAPLGNCMYKNLNFKIFNRWSELVFETNTTQNGWNGFYKNTEQQVDSYTWILEYTDSKGKRYYQKGTLSLLR